MILPPSFMRGLASKIGEEAFDQLVEALSQPPTTSIRIQPTKYHEHHGPSAKVPWCPLGIYLNERPIFTLDPSFHAGCYYVQEASSMFLWHVLESLQLKDKSTVRILDLSAAPGGKSTLILSWLKGAGMLCANEVIKNRAYTLRYNISKEGYDNVIVTNNDPADFKHLENFFDIILVDAPCSGEGMFRKDPNAIHEWSEDNVDLCSSRQKRIVSDIIPLLKPEGHLIYSTCTFNNHENIDNVHWMANRYNLDSCKVVIEKEWDIVEERKDNVFGYQFYPHKIRGEGFFIAVLQNNKPETINSHHQRKGNKSMMKAEKKVTALAADWISPTSGQYMTDKGQNVHFIPSHMVEFAEMIDSGLRIIYCGLTIGTLNKTIIIPDHALAFYSYLSPSINKADLNKEQALKFLKKELSEVDTLHKGWVLATYQGYGIGWFKNLGNRINNYLPNEHRILMKID